MEQKVIHPLFFIDLIETKIHEILIFRKQYRKNDEGIAESVQKLAQILKQ